MRILGLDPGIHKTGFGIIKYQNSNFKLLSFGCITTDKNSEFHHRLLTLIKDLRNLITEFKPDTIAIEQIFYNKNISTAMNVTQARGAIIHEIATHSIPFTEYNPVQVKKQLCNYGKAPKSQIQKMIQILLNLKQIPKPDDAADALALAICHASQTKIPHQTKNNLTS